MNASGRPLRLARCAVVGQLFVVSVAFFLSLLSGSGYAQEPAKKATPPSPSAVAPPPQTPQLAMPDAERIVLLARTTLLTLNDALHTGNFTVMRDMAAPGFSQVNSAARLAGIFSNLADQRVDLTAVAIIMPQLTEPPTLDQQNKGLRIKGFFPGQPIRIDFDIVYQTVEGRWRLSALSVQLVNVAPIASAPLVGPQTSPERKRVMDPKGDPKK